MNASSSSSVSSPPALSMSTECSYSVTDHTSHSNHGVSVSGNGLVRPTRHPSKSWKLSLQKVKAWVSPNSPSSGGKIPPNANDALPTTRRPPFNSRYSTTSLFSLIPTPPSYPEYNPAIVPPETFWMNANAGASDDSSHAHHVPVGGVGLAVTSEDKRYHGKPLPLSTVPPSAFNYDPAVQQKRKPLTRKLTKKNRSSNANGSTTSLPAAVPKNFSYPSSINLADAPFPSRVALPATPTSPVNPSTQSLYTNNNTSAPPTPSRPKSLKSVNGRKLTKRHKSRTTDDGSYLSQFIVKPLLPNSNFPWPTASENSNHSKQPQQKDSYTAAGLYSHCHTKELPPPPPPLPLAPPNLAHLRPSFLRSESDRRWTLAMADNVSDEAILAELNRLRSVRNLRSASTCLHGTSTPEEQAVGGEDDWIVGHRTLFACRELLKTEKNYLGKIELMYAAKSPSPPQPLIDRIPPLISVSKTLLHHWRLDSSAGAIAGAFLDCRERLESGFIEWGAVIGEFYLNGGKRDQKEMGRRSRPRPLSDAGMSERVPYQMQAGKRSVEVLQLRQPGVGASASVFSSSASVMSSSTTTTTSGGKRRPQMTLREGAIEPIQRVTRYVLLFRELLHHTSTTSASYHTVSDALSFAIRLAERCDRAQCYPTSNS